MKFFFSLSLLSLLCFPAIATDGYLDSKITNISASKQLKREKELDLLAKTVYHEARGESIRGQLKVAQVVVNRTKSNQFPNTITGVILSPRQFEWIDLWGENAPIDQKSKEWETAKKIAEIVVEGNFESGDLYYHATRIKPYWSLDKKIVKTEKVGKHIFYGKRKKS